MSRDVDRPVWRTAACPLPIHDIVDIAIAVITIRERGAQVAIQQPATADLAQFLRARLRG